MRVFVVPDEPVKIVQLKLQNTTTRMRRINVTYYAEWVLGGARENTAPYIVPEFAFQLVCLAGTQPLQHRFRTAGRIPGDAPVNLTV